ncbi:hypothetical protein Plhal703r1_c20g0090461 [Plasmopara halstedii]
MRLSMVASIVTLSIVVQMYDALLSFINSVKSRVTPPIPDVEDLANVPAGPSSGREARHSYLSRTTAESKVTEDTTSGKEKLPHQEVEHRRVEPAKYSHSIALKHTGDRPRSNRLDLSATDAEAVKSLQEPYHRYYKPYFQGYLNAKVVNFIIAMRKKFSSYGDLHSIESFRPYVV